METAWVETHREIVQRLVNALVRTLHFIATHDAESIAALMPEAFYAGNRALYVNALTNGKQMFSRDGRMPTDGPSTVLAVLSQIHGTLRDKTIDLSRTFTTQFVDAANQKYPD